MMIDNEEFKIDTKAFTPRERLQQMIIDLDIYLIQSYIEYTKLRFLNSIGDLAKVRSALAGLIVFQIGSLKNSFDNNKEQETWKKIMSMINVSDKKKWEEVFDVFLIMHFWMYEKGIIKLDNIPIIPDKTSIFDENKRFGFT